MLTKRQIYDATIYNQKALSLKSAAWPWINVRRDSVEYAIATALFQSMNGLTVDGKMGPITHNVVERYYGHGKINRFKDTDFLYNDEPEFKSRRTKLNFELIVLHETVTNSKADTIKHLQKKGYGYHYIIDAWGNVSQHVPLSNITNHCGRLNTYSIGIAFVTPYLEAYNKYPELWSTIDDRPWYQWRRKTDKYCPPNNSQIIAGKKLIESLCARGNVPLEFPTISLSKSNPRVTVAQAKDMKGIIAHRDFSKNRTDGRYPLEEIHEAIG